MPIIGVGVDPAVTYTEDSNETGIISGGLDKYGHVYIFSDASLKAPPTDKLIDGEMVTGWASVVDDEYETYQANFVVGEVNNGGDLVESVVTQHNPNMNYEAVRASRGKYTRAEPIARLYEKGLVHHVRSADLQHLEDQMVNWIPGENKVEARRQGKKSDSPDRIDALVWLIWKLKIDRGIGVGSRVLADRKKWEPLFYAS
jgi:phage terminase large subunit-like protein